MLRTLGLGLQTTESLFGFLRKRNTSTHPLETVDPRQYLARYYLSLRYLRGSGIEIGALHEPLPVFLNAKVQYVDRLTVEEMRVHYPELGNFDLVTPDIVTDGESLAGVADESLDFIIANHMIEHCENPIGALESFLSKLRAGGVLYMAIPNKEHTFDLLRPLTTIEHLLADYAGGAADGRRDHYEEFVRLVAKLPAEQIQAEVKRLEGIGYSIHFHVWNEMTFTSMLEHLRVNLGFPFQIVEKVVWLYNPFEIIYLLRKMPG